MSAHKRSVLHRFAIVAALAAAGGACDNVVPASQRACPGGTCRLGTTAQALDGTSFEGAIPTRRLLVRSTAVAKSADVEAFLKDQILPILSHDGRVRDVAVFVDDSGGATTYIVQADIRSRDPISVNLARDIIASGSTPGDADAILAQFAKSFDVGSAQVLAPRYDLSIARNIFGVAQVSQ